jgi:hypothetical protein
MIISDMPANMRKSAQNFNLKNKLEIKAINKD